MKLGSNFRPLNDQLINFWRGISAFIQFLFAIRKNAIGRLEQAKCLQFSREFQKAESSMR